MDETYTKKNTQRFDRYIKTLSKKNNKSLSADAISLLDSYLHNILETRIVKACRFRDTANPSRVTLLKRDIQAAIYNTWNAKVDREFTEFVRAVIDRYKTRSDRSRTDRAGLTISVGRVERLVRNQDCAASHQNELCVFIYVAALIEFVILFVFRHVDVLFSGESHVEKNMIAKVFEKYPFLM